ncbi:hypothetical protein MNBD_CHLOROFLEXI01-4750, partial [hydrothermal vent metagenome]
EIVIAAGGIPNGNDPSVNRNGGLIVYELISDSGTNWTFSVKSGWPFVMPDDMGAGVGARDPDGVCDGIRANPTLGDIDGDGDLEIISIAFDRRIRAFHHDGTVVNGWPIDRANGDIILRGGQSSAAIGDIDNDGLNEIIIGTNSPPWNGDNGLGSFPPQYNVPDYSLATLWAINGDSSLVPGFPIITEQIIKSSPALGDIDGDGDLEIVVGTGEFPGYVNGRQVYAWHTDGTPVSGWPKSTSDFMLSSPALADLDGNGVLDVIIGCGTGGPPFCSTLYAWDGSGNNLPGFPFNTPYTLPYAPIIADIDGDNNLEIILTSLATDKVIVVQHDGSNSPIDTSRATNAIILSSPLVDDLDGDGSLETVIGGATSTSNGEAAVFIFDEVSSTSPDPQNIPWPAFQRNSAHTGLSLPASLNLVNDLYIFHQQGSGSIVSLETAVANIGGEELDWAINTNGAGTAVQTVPASGTLKANESQTVMLTVNTSSYTTNQWHNLDTITLSGITNSQPAANSPQTISVNLYIGDISRIYLPSITK